MGTQQPHFATWEQTQASTPTRGDFRSYRSYRRQRVDGIHSGVRGHHAARAPRRTVRRLHDRLACGLRNVHVRLRAARPQSQPCTCSTSDCGIDPGYARAKGRTRGRFKQLGDILPCSTGSKLLSSAGVDLADRPQLRPHILCQYQDRRDVMGGSAGPVSLLPASASSSERGTRGNAQLGVGCTGIAAATSGSLEAAPSSAAQPVGTQTSGRCSEAPPCYRAGNLHRIRHSAAACVRTQDRLIAMRSFQAGHDRRFRHMPMRAQESRSQLRQLLDAPVVSQRIYIYIGKHKQRAWKPRVSTLIAPAF
jgi:hypothetical protein